VPAVTLVPADLEPFATIDVVKAAAMIEDAMAIAARVAPCIITAEFTYAAAAKAILRGAVIRWHEAGSGAMSAQSTQIGPFGQQQTMDTRQTRRSMFWPSEIEQLQDLCKGPEQGGAFDIDTVSAGSATIVHADSCALFFGALYCSCGAVLTGLYPLYGG